MSSAFLNKINICHLNPRAFECVHTCSPTHRTHMFLSPPEQRLVISVRQNACSTNITITIMNTNHNNNNNHIAAPYACKPLHACTQYFNNASPSFKDPFRVCGGAVGLGESSQGHVHVHFPSERGRRAAGRGADCARYLILHLDPPRSAQKHLCVPFDPASSFVPGV